MLIVLYTSDYMKKIIVNLPAAFLVQIWSFKRGKEMHTSGYFKKYSIISNLAHFEQMVEQSKKKPENRICFPHCNNSRNIFKLELENNSTKLDISSKLYLRRNSWCLLFFFLTMFQKPPHLSVSLYLAYISSISNKCQ